MVANNQLSKEQRFESTVLLGTVFIVGLCTIIYELLIGSVSSYFLGDSITQFSITIGLSMTAMGIGTLCSRYIKDQLIHWFVFVEFALGLVGGLSVPLLFAAYTYTSIYYPIMVSLIMIIGILVGLEIPILTRIMEGNYSLRANISNVLTLDYFGALIATILFPFALLPFFGIFQSSIITGGINLTVGLFNLWCFREKLGISKYKNLRSLGYCIVAAMIGLFIFSQSLLNAWESTIYEDRVILSKRSRYQKIVLTKNKDDIRLYLDGNLQFSSIDEYRYHEALAHIPLSLTKQHESVLILGGGDGLLAREILKYQDVGNITIVDLDEEVTLVGRNQPLLKKLNQNSLQNPRVKVINADAFKYLQSTHQYYDLVLADLPDPKNSSLSRLYSREFFKLIKKRLSKQGVFVTQSTSPFFAKKAFWCINSSIKAAGFKFVRPYHAYVPSFGDWGFMLAANINLDVEQIKIEVPTQFLSTVNVAALFNLPKDLKVANIDHSSLDSPNILAYYLEGWKYWN